MDGSAVARALEVGSPFFQQDTFTCKARGKVRFNSPVPLELKNIMLRLEDLKALGHMQSRSSRSSGERFIPSDDYSSAVWNGETFRFTTDQSKVVRILDRIYKEGLLDIHQDTIAAEINYAGIFRMEKIFRSGKTIHPAFGSLIRKTIRARYTLAP